MHTENAQLQGMAKPAHRQTIKHKFKGLELAPSKHFVCYVEKFLTQL
jgi:hypothetical protein